MTENIDGETVANPEFSNDFQYDENIQALYITYGNKTGKFSYQAGLRGEFSGVRTELKTTNEINDRTYTNLFPSAFLTYDFTEKDAVQLSYSRRIRRPRFWDLNPFFTLSDRRNIWRGNPNLDPEFTDSYELGYIKYAEKETISSSLYYRRTTDVINRIRRLNENNLDQTITQPENLTTQNDVGLEITYSYRPTEWWRINGDVNFFRSETSGTYEFAGEIIDLAATATTLQGRITSRKTLWKKVDVQLRYNYRAPRQTPQGRTEAIGHMDIAINRDIWNGNGTITLSVQDVFNSRRRQYTTETLNFFSEGEWQWRARQVILSINYRLNQQKRGGRPGSGRPDGY